MPTGITDAELSRTLTDARDKVLADPGSGPEWGEYGSVLLANLFDREAGECFIEASRLDPDDPRWPYARGQIALKRDPPAAVGFLTAAADAVRSRPEYRSAFALTLAEAFLERGEVDRAAEVFERESAGPGADRAAYGLGLVALARGDDNAARRQFESVRNNPSCRKQVAVQLAILARSRGDVETAKQLEAEANTLEADPPWPDPYLDRVVTLQVGRRGFERRVAMLERDDQFQAAADAYLARARVDRTCPILTGAGVNLARLKQYDEAEGLLREAVRLDPGDPKAHYTLALVLFTRAEHTWVADPTSAAAASQFREVVEEARRATELKPDHAQAYMFWGLALKNLGRPKEAIAPLKKGLGIRPEQFDLHLGLGQCLAATGDRKGAEASFQVARRLRPNDPRPPAELERLKGG
jgi:tetratricopeptide (TPR) repeat protein